MESASSFDATGEFISFIAKAAFRVAAIFVGFGEDGGMATLLAGARGILLAGANVVDMVGIITICVVVMFLFVVTTVGFVSFGAILLTTVRGWSEIYNIELM